MLVLVALFAHKAVHVERYHEGQADRPDKGHHGGEAFPQIAPVVEVIQWQNRHQVNNDDMQECGHCGDSKGRCIYSFSMYCKIGSSLRPFTISQMINSLEPSVPPLPSDARKARSNHFLQVLIATAMGDSLGLPFENMSKRRVRQRAKGPIRQGFLLEKGMISDDTEHALLTARSLMDAQGNAALFEQALSKRLKRWLISLAPGVGKATLMSIVSMWFKAPSRCGRPSAGNGPLMRAPIIGLYYNQDQALRDEFVKTSTLMTHRDPRALFMASGVADIVAQSSTAPIDWPVMSKLFREAAQRHAAAQDDKHLKELYMLLDHLDDAKNFDIGVDTALKAIGCEKGVDGYVYRSALASAFVASSSQDAVQATNTIILQGGDTDSTAALTAALCAAGGKYFPDSSMSTIRDWPVSQAYLEQHAEGLVSTDECQIAEPNYFKQLARNMALFWVAVFHIARGWLPPY
ncbi:hypothetical protein PLA107_031140 (plasmid) [Pseudomonas amygdali pv. lachrymans str. M301315]|nr:hypothetical protein PLA107_031140 [Pseudomonas amygdali pv. lachrymans str. M301315]